MNFPDKYKFDRPAADAGLKANLVTLLTTTIQLDQIPSTPEQTAAILSGEPAPTGSSATRQAGLALYQAYQEVMAGDAPLTATSILDLNRMITAETPGAGQLRDTVSEATDWRPPVPDREQSLRRLTTILTASGKSATEKAMDLALYLSRWQLFTTGNQRTAWVAANWLMRDAGAGVLLLPADKRQWYTVQLQAYCQAGRALTIKQWLYGNAVWGLPDYRVAVQSHHFVQNHYSPLNNPLDQ
ncbi:Fic family protein [Levilactobacillus namurensis]|uniref:Fic family protein n=1 Tax=Levilactobacillus namurensis TaxID=380393 RepID=A0AAW8W4R1_9LACO|nr:Fic family protein [Levilactobacillus namurensis]MDT7013733.1 Fic family protein [Levilactobacillus namurensis]